MRKGQATREETKERMSLAKLGRKYDVTHKLNMTLTHLITYADRHNICPAVRIKDHNNYDAETKTKLLQLLKLRDHGVSPSGEAILAKVGDYA